MKLLPLSAGKTTSVDNDVFEWASRLRWTAQKRKHGFHAARYDGKKYVYLHRLIMLAPDGMEVNHIDGNGLNNLRSNLELVTHAGNAQAYITKRQDTTSRFRGVCWHRVGKKWMARLGKKYLGLFEDEERAALAFDAAARQEWGSHAQLNFPQL